MRNPRSISTSSRSKALVAIATFACCSLQITASLRAQTPAELRQLVFYPTPLAVDAIDVSANATLLAADEVVDMARFEESGIGSYQRSIAALQATEGPFAAGLTEPLLSLALLYQEQSLHEEALEALDQAAAVSRVNTGLYTPEQISLAKHALTSLLALGRFDEVDARHHALVNLHQQYFGASSPETAAALKDLGQWQLESFHLALERPDSGQMLVARESEGLFANQAVIDSRFEELYQAQQNFVAAIRLLIEAEAWTDPALFELEQDLIHTFFINANRQRVLENPRSYALADESSRDVMHKKTNTMALPEDYSKGAEAYQRMIGYLKKNPATTIEQIADVMLGLADWHVLFGRHERAAEQRRVLEKLLVKTGTSSEQIAAILQPVVPVTLPAFLQSSISGKYPDADYKGYVDLALHLNRYGRVGRIEVLGSSADASAAVTDRLVTLLRNAQFRPAHGGSTATSVRYFYSY